MEHRSLGHRSLEHRSRSWIGRRLRSLALLELLNIPLQAVVWFVVLDLPVTAANAVGFGLFALLLLEGAAYWRAKRSQLEAAATSTARPGSPLPGLRGFAAARTGNVPVLLGGVAFTVWSVVDDPGAGSVPGLAFALFSVLEHINYFHWQLMHDTRADLAYLLRKGFRRSHLARDLAQGRALELRRSVRPSASAQQTPRPPHPPNQRHAPQPDATPHRDPN
ncbi:multidrug transporter [Streptomyces boninensis]|uniref:multidrug transporter n=1 Tax=Streptomyces boninensis TaxID=2039455 RepID=UPI003B224520